jgi:hypothetical protein
MNDVLGQGEDGYGLALLLSAPITNQNRLTAQAWQNLQIDLDTAHRHITNTATNITSIVTGTTVVTAALINEFWDAAQFIVENRYECHPQQYFKDAATGESWNTTNGSSSRTANWGLSPTVSITHEVNVVWASAAVRSYFFNSGGLLEWKPYHTNAAMTPNTSLNDLDTEWASFINHVQGQGGWDYDHTTYRDWDTTATTYSSGTLRINIVADQETDRSIRFVCTFTNVETPQLVVTPSTQYYNILY